MIDVPKLITELEQSGDGWSHHSQAIGVDQTKYLRDLCRRAAMALKERRDDSAREVMHRLGLVLIELGKKLTGQNDA